MEKVALLSPSQAGKNLIKNKHIISEARMERFANVFDRGMKSAMNKLKGYPRSMKRLAARKDAYKAMEGKGRRLGLYSNWYGTPLD